MDKSKSNSLKAELSNQPEPQLVAIERFFDGNDDEGSIGCNLSPHPGMDKFRSVLCGLLRRKSIDAVYAQIFEIDQGRIVGPMPIPFGLLEISRLKIFRVSWENLNPTKLDTLMALRFQKSWHNTPTVFL